MLSGTLESFPTKGLVNSFFRVFTCSFCLSAIWVLKISCFLAAFSAFNIKSAFNRPILSRDLFSEDGVLKINRVF
jgi:hypothetical protein